MLPRVTSAPVNGTWAFPWGLLLGTPHSSEGSSCREPASAIQKTGSLTLRAAGEPACADGGGGGLGRSPVGGRQPLHLQLADRACGSDGGSWPMPATGAGFGCESGASGDRRIVSFCGRLSEWGPGRGTAGSPRSPPHCGPRARCGSCRGSRRTWGEPRLHSRGRPWPTWRNHGGVGARRTSGSDPGARPPPPSFWAVSGPQGAGRGHDLRVRRGRATCGGAGRERRGLATGAWPMLVGGSDRAGPSGIRRGRGGPRRGQPGAGGAGAG